MDALLKEWGPIVSWFLTSGALLGFLKSLYDSIKKRKAGVSTHEHKRRVDIVVQRDEAETEARIWMEYAFDLRNYCQRHGTSLDDLPPIPIIPKRSE